MKKQIAIEKLGGNNASAAAAIGITRQAIGQWPDILPPRLVDRVEAAAARLARAHKTRKTRTTAVEKVSESV